MKNLPQVKLTKSELKTATKLLKEIINYRDPLYDADMVKVEIVDKATDVIVNWNAPNSQQRYGTRFSSLSEDAQGAARGIQANYFDGRNDELFNVTTTHDLDCWKFSKGAIDSLAVYLLQKAFKTASRIQTYAQSCNPLAGSKYRPSHRKLAEKIFKIVAEESNAELINCIEDYIVDVDAAAEVEIANAKEIESEIKYTYKSIFNRKIEVVNYDGEIETLKKLNKMCEREFNASLLRKENLLDLASIAEKIGNNLKTINHRENQITQIRRGIEIKEQKLAELQENLAKYKTPHLLTDDEIASAPSVVKIYDTVLEEFGVRTSVSGKYQVCVRDGYRNEVDCVRFKTLKDAVKIARIMHREVNKVSRHVEVEVKTRRMKDCYCIINNEYIDKDFTEFPELTTFCQIDNYGKEFVKRNETVDVIAELDERTVEEVQNDICKDGDNYGVYKNSTWKTQKKTLIGKA